MLSVSRLGPGRRRGEARRAKAVSEMEGVVKTQEMTKMTGPADLHRLRWHGRACGREGRDCLCAVCLAPSDVLVHVLCWRRWKEQPTSSSLLQYTYLPSQDQHRTPPSHIQCLDRSCTGGGHGKIHLHRSCRSYPLRCTPPRFPEICPTPTNTNRSTIAIIYRPPSSRQVHSPAAAPKLKDTSSELEAKTTHDGNQAIPPPFTKSSPESAPQRIIIASIASACGLTLRHP
ncbi:hypothetical protein B0T11DRAFT_98079 [Plectosphaerella cucumerina]|uniref:Uncharacterized protein n=1 Tax=Plectosphaerella cucumerina TaxID=40658 RepID=A0A8K0X0S3_9PEZI|nr:hypothetical protein B0T11DRAFT_98079 [Plectosphaerella cucumerina]